MTLTEFSSRHAKTIMCRKCLGKQGDVTLQNLLDKNTPSLYSNIIAFSITKRGRKNC